MLRKVRGTRMRAVKTLVEYFVTNRDEIADDRIFLTHLNCEEEAQYISDNLKQEFPGMEIVPAKLEVSWQHIRDLIP